MQYLTIKDEFEAYHTITDEEDKENPEAHKHFHTWKFIALISATKVPIDMKELFGMISNVIPSKGDDLNEIFDLKNPTPAEVVTKLYDRIQEILQARFHTSIVALELYDTENTGVVHNARI